MHQLKLRVDFHVYDFKSKSQVLKEKGLVSIVSGFYNRGYLVDDSIRSLIEQSYKNIEILIFDDASTDDTHSKLSYYQDKYQNIKVIRYNTNVGFVNGLIQTINLCRGEFIAIHGSGDISLPTRIERQVDVLSRNSDIGVVGCGFVNKVVGRDGEIQKETFFINKVIEGTEKYEILEKNYFSHGEVMFRKDLYDKVGGYRREFKFAQDRDLWCRLSRETNFYIVDEILYVRFIFKDGVSGDLHKLLMQKHLSEFARQNHELVLNGKPDLISLYSYNAFFMFRFNNRFGRELFLLARHKLMLSDRQSVSFISNYLLGGGISLYSISCFLLFDLLYVPTSFIYHTLKSIRLWKKK